MPKASSARHIETHTAATGAGAAAATKPRAAKTVLWDLEATIPKWTPRAIGSAKSLPPETAAALELETAKGLRSLRKTLVELCQSRGLKSQLRPLTLERWRWSSKWEEEQAIGKKGARLHPVIPSKAAPDAEAELSKELQRQGLTADDAASAALELRKASSGVADRLLKQAHAIASGGKPVVGPKLTLTFNRHNIDIACGKTFVKGDGFQAAIGRPVWQVLQASLGVACECFASPLNAYLPAFGSGFVDVDGPFGSRGSFFTFKPSAGSFAANPPFVHPIMDAAAKHILSLLQAAADAEGDHALSFAVIIPGWQESGCYQSLLASQYLTRHVLIAAADHGFTDGVSYGRQDPYRHSPFDTAVLVLQTAKAARKWPANATFESALRAAFAECVPSASALARQLKRDAGAAPLNSGEDRKRKREQRKNGGDGGSGDGRGKRSRDAPPAQFDAATEKQLNIWVQAKRKGDFTTADEIRKELYAKGVDAAAARPPRQKVAADKSKNAAAAQADEA